MDTEKTSKDGVEILDINDVMNRLITKVALTVQDERPAQRKDLIEIRDILIELTDVDKTLAYNILPETLVEARKAVDSIRVTNPNKLKELNEIVRPFEQFEKIDENDVPISDAEKREKFNEVIDSQLQSTIKTINEVVLIVDANEKANIETPKSELATDKIVNEILLSLLADRLKAINEVFLPEDEDSTSKNIEEVELNPDRQLKESRTAFSDTEKRFKEFTGVSTASEGGEKEIPDVNYDEVEVEQKEIQRIGQFPNLSFKARQELPEKTVSGEKTITELPEEVAGEEKTITELPEEETPSVDNGLLKTQAELLEPSRAEVAEEKVFDPLDLAERGEEKETISEEYQGDIRVNPDSTEDLEKSIVDIEQTNSSTNKLTGENELGAQPEAIEKVGPAAGSDYNIVLGADDGDIKISQEIGDAANQVEKSNITNGLSKGVNEGKAGSPESWYERIFFQAPNAVGVNAAGVLGNVGLNETTSAAVVGATLSFLAINVADITRYINKGVRELNTSATSLAITSDLLLIQAQRSADFNVGGGQYKTTSSEANIAANTAVYQGGVLRNTDESKEIATQENEAAIQQIISQYELQRKESGDDTEATASLISALVSVERERDGNEKAMFSGKISGAGIVGVIKKFPTPESDRNYSQYFRQRTEQISGINKRATGFIKIFNKRAPKFDQSDATNQILPFQFEPIVTGDTKSAEYSGLSTLARSQSAQVYKKSTERSINVELKYIVTGPSMDPGAPNPPSTNSGSRSTQGMELWDEEYIYTYIVRNFRNLTLPNLKIGTYRLAPPIVQIWYGGISEYQGSSTGVGGISDPNNDRLNDSFPTFRTNWYSTDETGNRGQRSFRSLWVCKSVGFTYDGGIINRITRNKVSVTVQLQLTEIAPSVTDNEVYLWRSLGLTEA